MNIPGSDLTGGEKEMCCVGDVVVWGVGGVAGWQSTVAGVETHQDWRLRAVSGYPDTRAD